MEQINIIGLKSLMEWFKEQDLQDGNDTRINKLLRDKILYSTKENRFYRVSNKNTIYYSDNCTNLYFLGRLKNWEKIQTTPDIQKIKTNDGLTYGLHYFSNLVIVGEYKMTKREQINTKIVKIKNDISSKQNELNFEEGKITYMDENSLEEFDENEYKVYNALKALDSNSSVYDKAKVIAGIINQK